MRCDAADRCAPERIDRDALDVCDVRIGSFIALERVREELP